MKMRDLEATTGVNRETIRVYFRHGLLPDPVRPKPNVADYDDSHVRAITAVRDLQRDSGLTLKQIKDILNGQTGGRRVEAGAFHNLEALVATRVGIDDRLIQLSSLTRAWPRAEKDARVFHAIGLVDLVETADGPALSVSDSRLVTIWGEMRQAGLDESIGFKPEMLSIYLQPAHAIASQEAALFLEHTEGRIPEEKAAAIVHQALRGMLDFFGILRVKFFLRHIHRENPGLMRRQSKPRSANVKGPPRKAG